MNMSKSYIIYDSKFGNTKKIAEAIGEGLGNNTEIKNVDENPEINFDSLDLLVIGSPTHGGQASEKIKNFLQNLPQNSLTNTKVATFDTRMSAKDQNFWLRTLMKIIGFAGPKILKKLESVGGQKIAEPEGFLVKGKQGPTLENELERALKWGKKIKQNQ